MVQEGMAARPRLTGSPSSGCACPVSCWVGVWLLRSNDLVARIWGS